MTLWPGASSLARTSGRLLRSCLRTRFSQRRVGLRRLSPSIESFSAVRGVQRVVANLRFRVSDASFYGIWVVDIFGSAVELRFSSLRVRTEAVS